MGDDHDEMRPCPLCGEDIKAQAIKCRHCGEMLKGGGAARGGGMGYDPKRKALEDASNLALILGLLGVLVCNLTGPFAIMKGNEAKRIADQARVPVPGTATAGVVLGWIACALLALSVLLVGGFFVMFVLAAAAGGR